MKGKVSRERLHLYQISGDNQGRPWLGRWGWERLLGRIDPSWRGWISVILGDRGNEGLPHFLIAPEKGTGKWAGVDQPEALVPSGFGGERWSNMREPGLFPVCSVLLNLLWQVCWSG